MRHTRLEEKSWPPRTGRTDGGSSSCSPESGDHRFPLVFPDPFTVSFFSSSLRGLREYFLTPVSVTVPPAFPIQAPTPPERLSFFPGECPQTGSLLPAPRREMPAAPQAARSRIVHFARTWRILPGFPIRLSSLIPSPAPQPAPDGVPVHEH